MEPPARAGGAYNKTGRANVNQAATVLRVNTHPMIAAEWERLTKLLVNVFATDPKLESAKPVQNTPTLSPATESAS
jgi:hypothetical protein